MTEAPLLDRVRAHVAAARLCRAPGLAVLAVSGGGDSLALLDLMCALAPELELSLVVAHADHGILPESAQIAERVARLARERYGLETVTGALALGPDASETRARVARYRFLRAAQEERGARYLVTAHHADDQVETVLQRFLKGSAPAGLRGIPARGPRGLVRPLLPFTKAELTAHARAAGLPMFEDPSNTDPRHLRGWVRTVLRPAIEARLGPDAASRILSLARHAGREARAWALVLERLPALALRVRRGRFEVARAVLAEYDNVLAGRILRAAAARAGIRLGPDAASRLARFAAGAASGRRVHPGGGVVAEAAFATLIVERAGQGKGTRPARYVFRGETGEVAFGHFTIAWRREAAPEKLPRRGWTTWLPAGSLAVRRLRPGDRLAPLGGVGRRRAVRLLMEARVARTDRSRWPVVTSGRDVVWIPGICRAGSRVPRPGAAAVRIDARSG